MLPKTEPLNVLPHPLGMMLRSPCPLRFAQPAGCVDHHFLRAGRVQELPASSGLTGKVRVQPVGLGP